MNIVVNGGTRGIGKEVAIYLAKNENNHVLVTGRDEKSLKNLSEKYKSITAFPVDLAVLNTQKKIFKDFISNKLQKVDILINVAGMLVAKEFENIDDYDARMMMEINFFAPASIIRLLKPIMPKGSHIVNLSSMGAFQGSEKYKGLSYYSASKAALSCLSECLATEFKDSGISVNCLALGSVQTEMLSEAFPGYKAPVKPEEIAEYIGDFALKAHRFINGKVLPVAINNP